MTDDITYVIDDVLADVMTDHITYVLAVHWKIEGGGG